MCIYDGQQVCSIKRIATFPGSFDFYFVFMFLFFVESNGTSAQLIPTPFRIGIIHLLAAFKWHFTEFPLPFLPPRHTSPFPREHAAKKLDVKQTRNNPANTTKNSRHFPTEAAHSVLSFLLTSFVLMECAGTSRGNCGQFIADWHARRRQLTFYCSTIKLAPLNAKWKGKIF